MKLIKNTILITGGTSGLGLTFATKLLALGNTVIVTGRDQARLEQTKRKLTQVHTIKSDVSDPAAIVRLYAEVSQTFPSLNILINNAGEIRKIVLADSTDNLQEITREIETNLMGPVRMIQQFLPHLLLQKEAAILNVTSGLALVPLPLSPVYGATKSGLHSYTQSLRVQLKHSNIKVFELMAPAANTPLNDAFADVDGFNLKDAIEPDKIIDAAITGLQKDHYEIVPGMARVIKTMSRLAPALLLKQTSKIGAQLIKAGVKAHAKI